MFAKRKTTINGVELPSDFEVGSIINNVAISADGTKYAAVVSGGLVVADVPADGRINVEGNEMTFSKRGGISLGNIIGGVFGNISGNSITMGRGNNIQVAGSGGSVIITGANSGYDIDEGYEGVSSLRLKGGVNDVNLGISEDNKLYIRGEIKSKPVVENGRLYVEGLEGKIITPKNPSLELDITNSTGDIEGDVVNKGRIQTSVGGISLRLYSPLEVEAETSVGEIDITGMISRGRGLFSPPDQKPIGKLTLRTSTGDIHVDYCE